MSAAPVPQPPPNRRSKGICKTPVSYFEVLLNRAACNFAQMKVFGIILDATIGEAAVGATINWAPIDWEEFHKKTSVSAEWCRTAAESLQQMGVIEMRAVLYKRGKQEFRIAPSVATETRAEPIKGRCSQCKSVTTFKTEFIPEPREFFTTVAAGLDHASYCVLAVITRHSHKWTAKTGLESFPVELDRNDFERALGLDPKSITNAIAKLKSLNLIEVQDRPGKPSLYRSLPENFSFVGKRKARTVTRTVTPRPRGEENHSEKVLEKPVKTTSTLEIESKPFQYAFCPHCAQVVEVEPVSEDEPLTPEVLPAEVKPEARSEIPLPKYRPGSERRVRDRMAETWEVLKRWHKIPS